MPMKWLRRIRGAVGMGVTWALGWAVAGILIGASSLILPFLPWETFFQVFDAPLPALGLPGFFAGVFFSIVLGIAARRRRFHELSLPAFAGWGAVGGLLLTLFPAALVALGLATPNPGANLVRTLAVVGGPFMLLGAASAAATLIVARRAERGIGSAEQSKAVGEGAFDPSRPFTGSGRAAERATRPADGGAP
jgi:hypothetical protein